MGDRRREKNANVEESMHVVFIFSFFLTRFTEQTVNV
jgi:hypothetical protein